MATTFQFELVSPARLLLSEAVVGVVAPGVEGEFTVLAGHAPFITTLKPGFITVSREGGREDRLYVRGGFAEVTPAKFTILAEESFPASDLTAEKLAAEIAIAEAGLAGALNEDTRQRAQDIVDHLKALKA